MHGIVRAARRLANQKDGRKNATVDDERRRAQSEADAGAPARITGRDRGFAGPEEDAVNFA